VTKPTRRSRAAIRTPEEILDPTENVLALVEAAVSRLDDMRSVDNQRLHDLRVADARRLDDLRYAESRRINEQMALHADYHDKLSVAEAKRIDAIRAVDVAAVAVASERAAQQANVLANQVAASAEALRALVATTAATVAQQLQQISTQFTERLAALEKAQYESKGKSGVADPMMAELMVEMRNMVKAQSTTSGKAEGIGASWGFVVAAAVLVVALLTIGTSLFGNKAAPVTAPQVIYVPAPAQTAPPATR
jgi:hypothetical protein